MNYKQIKYSCFYCQYDESGHNFAKEGTTWPRGYKTFSMLNSVEHEILNAHKYININKFGFF